MERGSEWVACHVPSRWDTFCILVCGLVMPTAGRSGHGRKAALPDGVLAPSSYFVGKVHGALAWA